MVVDSCFGLNLGYDRPHGKNKIWCLDNTCNVRAWLGWFKTSLLKYLLIKVQIEMFFLYVQDEEKLNYGVQSSSKTI